MGLDNIPVTYACKNKNTAVLDDDGRIDCVLTQNSGGCPWKNELDSSGIKPKVVLGMFGTDCWYRGKYAQYLIDSYDAPFSFYGEGTYDENGDESYGLDSEQCYELSDYMKYIHHNNNKLISKDGEDVTDDWLYISWWLEFVAKNCNGIVSWF